LACVALGLLATGLVAARLREEASVRAEASSAFRAFRSKRFDEALVSLGRWLHARPSSPDAHHLQARIAYAQGRFHESEVALARAKGLGLDEYLAERLDALLLARSGRAAEAEPTLARIFQASGDPDPEVAEVLARIYLETYRLGMAGAVLERWAREAPEDPKPYLWMTEIDTRAEQGGPEKAVGHYREALRRDPGLDKARLGLARALRESNRPEEALREFDLHLERHPDDVDARVEAARACLTLGRQADAISQLDRALSVDPDHVEALQEQAAIDLSLGGAERAIERLDRALKVDPYHAEATFRRGMALARLGRDPEAKAAFERSESLRADQARLRDIQRQFNANPADNGLRLAIARWMFEHGQPAQGIRWAKTVLGAVPTHREANLLLAAYYESEGDAGMANYYRLQAAPSPSP
jgi:tetratricopeptide (TPR) repeat protein